MLCVSQAVIGRNDECGGRQHIHACVCVCTRPVRGLTPSLSGANYAMATLSKQGSFFFQLGIPSDLMNKRGYRSRADKNSAHSLRSFLLHSAKQHINNKAGNGYA